MPYCSIGGEYSWKRRGALWCAMDAGAGTNDSATTGGLPTARGAMGMLSVFGPDDPHVVAAVCWLQSMQLDEVSAGDPDRNPDGDPAGSWVEREMTGTGFPRVFYLRYHMYRLYFPMMALGRYVTARQNSARPSECGASAMA